MAIQCEMVAKDTGNIAMCGGSPKALPIAMAMFAQDNLFALSKNAEVRMPSGGNGIGPGGFQIG